MKTIIYIFTAVWAVQLFSCNASAQDISLDPVKTYKAAIEFSPGDVIYKIVADVDGNGRKDILLSKTMHTEDGFEEGQAVPWEIFLAQPNGKYSSIGEKAESGINYDSVATFRIERFWIGKIPELGKFGILHLVSGRGGHAMCQLHGLVFEGTAFVDIPIGEPVESETHLDELLKRFPVKGRPVIETLKP